MLITGRPIITVCKPWTLEIYNQTSKTTILIASNLICMHKHSLNKNQNVMKIKNQDLEFIMKK